MLFYFMVCYIQLLLLIIMKKFNEFLYKSVKLPLFLLHLARCMTRLTGVRPAVKLSWKALTYVMESTWGHLRSQGPKFLFN